MVTEAPNPRFVNMIEQAGALAASLRVAERLGLVELRDVSLANMTFADRLVRDYIPIARSRSLVDRIRSLPSIIKYMFHQDDIKAQISTAHVQAEKIRHNYIDNFYSEDERIRVRDIELAINELFARGGQVLRQSSQTRPAILDFSAVLDDWGQIWKERLAF